MSFQVTATAATSAARRGTLTTAHGVVSTPMFMPVGTQAAVKAVAPRELEELGAAVILGNTYHLALRPGVAIVRDAGGLHKFMGWPNSILTDSGGYQIFSLSKLRRVTEEGVTFQSHVDGSTLFLGPREVMSVQCDLGADIAMVLDECTPSPCPHEEAHESLALTLKWARLCREQARAPGQQVFGIVQGGLHRDLRERAAAALVALAFDGYALGGLSVGEPEADMLRVLEWTVPLLPHDRPRYLMGVGTPRQMVEAVARGVDLFDCVLPTRLGRHGSAYTAQGTVPVKAARYKADYRPIEDGCDCPACRGFTRAYIRHLLNVDEMLGRRLLTLHNLHYYLNLMACVRRHLEAGTFDEFRAEFGRRADSEAAAPVRCGAAPQSP